jgi:tRNA threonylcarbamoyladenosine biosynthesis protein TsaE
MNAILISQSEDDTTRIASEFAATLRGGEIVLLSGELGAGKSVFVRGVARALGVTERVISPTFVLMRVYDITGHTTIRHLVHVDAYRIEGPVEIQAIGLEEWLDREDSVVMVEWGERASMTLDSRARSAVAITSAGRPNERRIVVGAAE